MHYCEPTPVSSNRFKALSRMHGNDRKQLRFAAFLNQNIFVSHSVNNCAELRFAVVFATLCNSSVLRLYANSARLHCGYTVAFLSHQRKRRTIDDLKKKTMTHICVAFLSVEENYGTRVCEAFLSGIIRRWIVSLAAATRRHLDIHTCVF